MRQGYAAQFRAVSGGGVPRFPAGENSALPEEAREGWRLFREAGCIRCHHGPLLSDGRFYRIGAAYKDPGRAAVTGDANHKYAFRTPGLRDVARTGPCGLPLDFEPLAGRSFSEIAPIVDFLESLTGEAPKILPPVLP